MKTRNQKNITDIMTTIIFRLFITLFVLLTTATVKAETPYEWHSQTEILNVGIENVIIAVVDYDNYLQIIPYVEKMKIMSRRGQESICYFEHYEKTLQKTFWTQLKFKIITNKPDKFVVHSSYLSGNAHPFESEIILEKLSVAQTRVTARMIVHYPGPSFVPDSVINYYINSFLKKSLEKLKNRFS